MRSGGATAPYRPVSPPPHTPPRASRSRLALRPRRGPSMALATRTTSVINGGGNCEPFMAQSRRIPAGIPTRKKLRRGCCAKATIRRRQSASNALQTLARPVKLNEPRLKRLEPVLMFGDDLLRRPGDEVVVAELGLGLGDFQLDLRDLPVEARLLRLK